jgi:hypothetical protein
MCGPAGIASTIGQACSKQSLTLVERSFTGGYPYSLFQIHQTYIHPIEWNGYGRFHTLLVVHNRHQCLNSLLRLIYRQIQIEKRNSRFLGCLQFTSRNRRHITPGNKQRSIRQAKRGTTGKNQRAKNKRILVREKTKNDITSSSARASPTPNRNTFFTITYACLRFINP